MNTERKRLLANVPGHDGWHHWGPYLSERQWGTVREDYSADGTAWDYLPARSCAQPRLSLGRGRHRGLQRRPPAPLLFAGAVERQRPDPEGAPVRPHERRRQSRRGREGAVLLPRRHAHAFVPEDAVQVSAGGISVRRAGGRRTAARIATRRNSNSSIPASSTTTATSTCSSNTPRPRPTTS